MSHFNVHIDKYGNDFIEFDNGNTVMIGNAEEDLFSGEDYGDEFFEHIEDMDLDEDFEDHWS